MPKHKYKLVITSINCGRQLNDDSTPEYNDESERMVIIEADTIDEALTSVKRILSDLEKPSLETENTVNFKDNIYSTSTR